MAIHTDQEGSMCSALKHCGVVSKNGKIVQRTKKKNISLFEGPPEINTQEIIFLLLKNSLFYLAWTLLNLNF